MKKIWYWFILLCISFLITFIQTATDLGWWSFSSSFLKSGEKFTFFLVMPVSLIVCFFGSIKLLAKEKSVIYLTTLVLPLVMAGIMIYFFLVRVLDAIFFSG